MAFTLPSATVELHDNVRAPFGAAIPSKTASYALSRAPVVARRSKFVTMGMPLPETLKIRCPVVSK
jgi:hypothetical protein